jgi:hypothetical protein
LKSNLKTGKLDDSAFNLLNFTNKEKNMSGKEGNNINIEKQDQVLFIMLIQQHQKIALMGLGEQENPATGKIEKDLNAVKYAIDTISMLQKFMAGNLTPEMSGYLESTLNDLRDKYTSSVRVEDED